jgi:adenylate cyclase
MDRTADQRSLVANRSIDPDPAPVVAWLAGTGHAIADPLVFVDAFIDQLNAAGFDIARFTTGIPILHPQVFSWSALWRRNSGVSERFFQLTADTRAMFDRSPITVVYRGGGAVRCRIDTAPTPGEFPILADLRAEGLTDYLVLPALFSDGTTKALSFATDRPQGFSNTAIAGLEVVAPSLSMILEIQTLRRTATTLLETYVGRQTGRRVLNGAIQRGMQETLRAVIWFSDLQGFTSMSERLEGAALIDLLNDFFGALGQAIDAHGGEILKFIGDAMMAIFPLEEDGDPRTACDAALAAAAEAAAALAETNRRRQQEGAPRIACGMALHIGEVLYGNVGGTFRLDFTVIGPAVNLASRLEGLTRTTGRPMLLSAAFARASGRDFERAGTFPLKGVAEEETVYAPRNWA